MGTETAIPSGMLWMAMATAMAIPSPGSSRAATKVARPSGKLCIAMASAVKRPMRISFCSPAFFSSISSTFVISCGFSNDGMSLSMMAMRSMPPKNAAVVSQNPPEGPYSATSSALALGKISTKET